MHFHKRAIGIAFTRRIFGKNLHRNCSFVENQLVLHIQHCSRVLGRIIRNIVDVVVVDIDGLSRGIIHTTFHVRLIIKLARVVIGNQNQIGGAIIDKWNIKVDDCPSICSHGDRAAKHEVGR